ncbi:hypothetical protein FQN54_005185 [Arachnomyces sp. PD_36]|nr:hypothetical protein FQN54_005185 [Arachnomyces sp. PD_36]
MLATIFALAIFLPGVSGSDWDDFTNNLATDLAPLLALFGEQVTKQFLSESINLTDNIIFAMAPLGVLTAVVSVIRVCGGPSLRAFVGRAQEGHGDAEAELCSSTSHDVCELWNRGGIARVFGRPKILEFIHHPIGHEDFHGPRPTAGLYRPDEYFQTERGRDHWEEIAPLKMFGVNRQFAPHPNLSLNIGIRKIHRFWFSMIALLGCLLQSSVLGFAVWATYYGRLLKDGDPIQPWAFPLAALGTVLLCGGMLLCAWLIERSTIERVFKKKTDNEADNKPKLHWLQPGDQLVGDQTFDAFAHSAFLKEYMTSWKLEGFSDEFGANRDGKLVWIAVFTTMTGFVLQFVGLRGLHSSVAMFQLGITLVMAGVRAGLRTQRLGESQNKLKDFPYFVEGHELDWQAFQLGGSDESQKVEGWEIIDPLSHAVGSRDIHESGRNYGERVMKIRARLARFTDSEAPSSSESWKSKVRELALCLKDAVENAANLIFSGEVPLKEGWQGASVMPWRVDCRLTTSDGKVTLVPISLPLRLNNGMWEIEKSQIEAVLGLWSWSLQSAQYSDRRAHITSEKNFAAALPSVVQKAALDLKMWIMRDFDVIVGSNLALPDSYQPRSTRITAPEGMENGGMAGGIAAAAEHSSSNPSSGQNAASEQVDSSDSIWAALSVPTTIAMRVGYAPTSYMEVAVFSTRSRRSLLARCAQDLFTSFVDTIADVVSRLTDITPLERQTLGDDSRGTPISHNAVQFSNTHVESLATAFTDAGLGSKEDALMSIIPPFLAKSKLPLPDQKVLSWVVKQRHGHNFVEARDYLIWAYYNIENTPSLIPELERVVRAMGELYRRAMRASGEDSRIQRLGYDGVLWMLLTLGSSNERVNNLKENYGWVALQMAGIAGDIGFVRKLMDAGADPEKVPGFNGMALQDALEAREIYPLGLLIVEKWGNEITANLPEQMPLPRAASSGCIELVEDLLDIGADPHSEDPTNGCTPLTSAAKDGHREVVNLLLEAGAVTRADGAGWTPLLWAAKNGHNGVVELLLRHSEVNADFKDAQHRRTPLSYAAEGGHITVVEQLLKMKVELNTKDHMGRTPLSWAASRGHRNVVQLLLRRRSIDINSTDLEFGKTALSWAASMGHKDVVQLLVAHDPSSANTKDYGGRTPLSWAAASGQVDVVDVLIWGNVALVDTKDNSGRTPLSWAAGAGHNDVLQLLIKQDHVIPDSRDNSGRSPVSWAAAGGHEEAVQSLIKWHDVEADSMDNDGWTPLLWAAVGKHEAVVQLLMSREDVKTTAKSPYNWSLLSWPVWEGQETAVKLLLTQDGFAVDSNNDKGFVSLWWATVNRHEAAVRLLREKNWIGPNTKGSQTGQTLIWWAAVSGNAEVVALLLEKDGAKVNSSYPELNQTPLWWAAGNGHATVVEQFIVKGGVELNAKDFRTGQSLLSHAAAAGQKSVVKLLIDRKDVDLNARDLRSGRTPLSWAAGNGHLEVTRSLLEKENVELNSKDSVFNQTPLSWAAENGHVEVVRVLLARNDIDIHCKDSKYHRTPVLWAEENAHEVVVSLLLTKLDLRNEGHGDDLV